jgi:hypothetical protein
VTVKRLNKKIERQLRVNGGATGLIKVTMSLDFSDLGPRTIIIGIGIVVFTIVGCFCCCLLLLKLNYDNLIEGLVEALMAVVSRG